MCFKKQNKNTQAASLSNMIWPFLTVKSISSSSWGNTDESEAKKWGKFMSMVHSVDVISTTASKTRACLTRFHFMLFQCVTMGRNHMYRRPWQGSQWPWKGCPGGFEQATCLDLSLMKDSAAAVQPEQRDKMPAMLERLAHRGYIPPSGHWQGMQGYDLNNPGSVMTCRHNYRNLCKHCFPSVCLQNQNKEQRLKRQRKGTHIDLSTIEAILVNHAVNKKDKNKNKKAGNFGIM